jgi:hypothetical protein
MREPLHNKTYNPSRGTFRASKRVITVFTVFKEDGGWSIYHCPDCRNPVAQYKGDLVAEVPGETKSKYPVMIQCKNPNCGRKVMFKSSTEQVTSND